MYVMTFGVRKEKKEGGGEDAPLSLIKFHKTGQYRIGVFCKAWKNYPKKRLLVLLLHEMVFFFYIHNIYFFGK